MLRCGWNGNNIHVITSRLDSTEIVQYFHGFMIHCLAIAQLGLAKERARASIRWHGGKLNLMYDQSHCTIRMKWQISNSPKRADKKQTCADHACICTRLTTVIDHQQSYVGLNIPVDRLEIKKMWLNPPHNVNNLDADFRAVKSNRRRKTRERERKMRQMIGWND